jgi:hypothetical protein
MEDRVDFHGRWKCEAIGNGGQFGCDFEGAVSSWRKFRGWVVGFQVTAFQPNLFVFLELDWNKAFFGHAKRGFCFILCFSDLSESRGDVGDLGFFVE